jgi:hypothetical protein
MNKEYIEACLELADSEQSKITERERRIFGLSSTRLRHFISNICAQPNTKYLEIGVYKGATLLSAAVNNPTITAVGIENFSYDEREPLKKAPEGTIWENIKSHLYDNISRYRDPNSGVNIDNIHILEKSYKEVNWDELPKFNVCFFDITPIEEDSYDILFDNLDKILAPEAVVIISGYSNERHAKAINKKLEKVNNLAILSRHHRTSGGLSDARGYYSGILALSVKNNTSVTKSTTPATKKK